MLAHSWKNKGSPTVAAGVDGVALVAAVRATAVVAAVIC